eukprot:XP_011538849.1 HERV-H LTR-associating protein 3 isoform X1 [Homo sapiens]
MFGACYKQPLKPSGSEPPAEECRMTPRHAGCDVTEMQRILSQPTFTEHLLRAVCTKLANMYSTSTDCREHCRRGMKAKQLKAEAGRLTLFADTLYFVWQPYSPLNHLFELFRVMDIVKVRSQMCGNNNAKFKIVVSMEHEGEKHHQGSCQRKGVPIQTPREHSWISCKKEFEANP